MEIMRVLFSNYAIKEVNSEFETRVTKGLPATSNVV